MPLDFSQWGKNCPLKNMYIFYPACIRKNSQEIEKKTLQGKNSEEPFRKATEEDPSRGWRE